MSRVPRSMEATEPGPAGSAAELRRSFPNGVWGIALFIATEATLFGTLIASYWYLRFRHPDWPLGDIAPPKAAAPLALTAVLVATSIPMFLGSAAAGRGQRQRALLLVLLAALVQAGYLAAQIHLFADDLSKFTPKTNAYGSIYFTMLAAHHFHVLLGILLDLFVVWRLVAGLTNYRVIGVRAISWYWHFVNAVAVIVTLTQVSPSL